MSSSVTTMINFQPSQAFLSGMDNKTYKKEYKKYKKNKKNKKMPPAHDWTPFRAAEKRFKAKFPPLDFSGVLDLRQKEVGVFPTGNLEAFTTKQIGMNGDSLGSRQAYIVPKIPGLVIIPNYLSPDEQRNLVRWSLKDQARSPNYTNLDIHYHLPEEGLWNCHIRAEQNNHAQFHVQPKRPVGPEPPQYPPEGPRLLIDNKPGDVNFEDEQLQPKPLPPPSLHLPPVHASKLTYKLRWANLGYSYHWGSKSYDFSKPNVEFPGYLKSICKRIVASINWDEVWDGTNKEVWGEAGPDWQDWPQTFEPDAGIVNFYQHGDTLCGHVDRSEVCKTSPLVSISLGNAAIFLIGGLSRDIDPVPIMLRSGDVIIMSGPDCRRAYHGVPRILEGTLPAHFQSSDQEWLPFQTYLETTRINVNVRQVFPRGFNTSAKYSV